MNKYMRSAIALLLAFCMVFESAWAMTGGDNACENRGVVFGFFNGVLTTPEDADRASNEFRRWYGDVTTNGDKIQYEVLYNYTNGFEDFVETFEQRLQEQGAILDGRFELFFEALHGGGHWWSNLTRVVRELDGVLAGFSNWVQAAIARGLTELLATPPTTENYAEHQTRITNWILEGQKLLFVAHSQGNLFANAAYRFATSKVPAESVGLVHIGPASPQLNGRHTLADKDLVINALRLAGSAADNTDVIPGYLERPSGLNGQTDILGHGLLEIYLNPAFTTSARIQNDIERAFATLVAPPPQASPGFFTATLTWDGTGDVDLHTFEPAGTHVFYRHRQGEAGYLDVDNVIAYGPEHYFATCDASALQTGTYRIAVANYRRAEGRVATVQIASWADGVLGTKSVLLGPETFDVPPYYLFDVHVDRNPISGVLNVWISG